MPKYSALPTVALRVRELRTARGLTQEALARKARVTTSTVLKVEGGRRTPSLAMLARLAGALGVETRDLI
jgi:transcriptional regulator with XRE-family HTH domain